MPCQYRKVLQTSVWFPTTSLRGNSRDGLHFKSITFLILCINFTHIQMFELTTCFHWDEPLALSSKGSRKKWSYCHFNPCHRDPHLGSRFCYPRLANPQAKEEGMQGWPFTGGQLSNSQHSGVKSLFHTAIYSSLCIWVNRNDYHPPKE